GKKRDEVMIDVGYGKVSSRDIQGADYIGEFATKGSENTQEKKDCCQDKPVLNDMGRPMATGAVEPVHPEAFIIPLPPILAFLRYLKLGRAAAATSSVFSYLTPKIVKQMGSRGWTQELIHNTINNPFTTRVATNSATGNASTAFFQKNGSYVVKDDLTNQVIQISNRLDNKWIPDATIINPYIPK
ncbi:colicin E5-related ribonuclease, partial [Algoriphagus antarcticus]